MTDAMKEDLRGEPLYRKAETMLATLRAPGTGQISDMGDLSAHDDRVVFSGTLVDRLEGDGHTRVCLTSLKSGDTRVLTFGPNADKFPRFAPDGKIVAFLSDRVRQGDFQLYFLDPDTGIARSGPVVPGWIEYFHWSPDGTRILLGVAGHGADVAGGQGAVASSRLDNGGPDWLPSIEAPTADFRWRTVWLYDLDSDSVRKIGGEGVNAWEAAWAGSEAIVAITSDDPDEAAWYEARLSHFAITPHGEWRELFRPADQLGLIAGSPDGRMAAVVEAVCSDRGIVAGDLALVDSRDGSIRRVRTDGVDVTYVEWLCANRLVVAGHRGFETVVALYDTAVDQYAQSWASRERTIGGRYASVSALNTAGDFTLATETFLSGPELAVVRAGKYRKVRDFNLSGVEHSDLAAVVEACHWSAPDGQTIEGWLLIPTRQTNAPLPFVMVVHGGPISHHRQRWLGRAGLHLLMLIEEGFGLFLPNPRGSSGRGQAFARAVVGDMGGADLQDCLAGLDMLVARGLADASRLGVTGVSYGGYLTAWAVTQDQRFAAAAAVAPITNLLTERYVSNIGPFVRLFLGEERDTPDNPYVARSPITYVDSVRTPTLMVCGAKDRCTPPVEAAQFYGALRERAIESVLVTYPNEGHGIRTVPAMIDYAARLTAWFSLHMPSKSPV